MNKIANILIGAIAALHCVIAYIEMFAWTSLGPKMFKSFSPDIFEPTTAIAANQGIYNVFLVAGLLWALVIKDATWRRNVASCFLLFVAVAGIFGALTLSISILYVQTVPSVIALVFLHLGKAKPVVSN
jgi:putative membrane protein